MLLSIILGVLVLALFVYGVHRGSVQLYNATFGAPHTGYINGDDFGIGEAVMNRYQADSKEKGDFYIGTIDPYRWEGDR